VVGAVVWISSELLFFGTLFGTWFSLRSSGAGPWPPEGVEVDVAAPAVGTVLLLTSSATVQLAAQRVAQHRLATARLLLLVTIALGTGFLALLAVEWSHLDFSVDDHAYGTAFYSLTGFHGLHVIGGLLAMGVMIRRVGRLGPVAHDSVEVVSVYWHAVDAVWLALFASVYLAA
jgi:cytochrome c oxidase subunit 3